MMKIKEILKAEYIQTEDPEYSYGTLIRYEGGFWSYTLPYEHMLYQLSEKQYEELEGAYLLFKKEKEDRRG